MKSDKYLLLDSQIVESVRCLELVLGEVRKDDNNPLFGEDKPWEVRFDNLYPNVIMDEEEKIYKCWYSPFIVSPPEEKVPLEKRKTIRFVDTELYPREMAVCYATSDDGINWIKPELGIYNFKGTAKNNIVYRVHNGSNEDGVHGAGVFKDNSEPDSSRRYKMFFSKCFANSQQVMSVSYSADGIHWAEPVSCKEINAVGDCHNNVLFAQDVKKYIGFTRLWNKKADGKSVRVVGYTDSNNFINWSEAKMVFEGLTNQKQIYAMPVFRYANVYLGLAAIFNEITDLVHCELTYSTDAIKWHRICPDKDFISLGADGSYDCGCIYAAVAPIILHDEISIYYAGSNGPHTAWRNGFLCLGHLRKDGFAGYQAKASEKGTIITKPIECSGDTMCLSADVYTGGSISITILDDHNNSLYISLPIETDITDGIVKWNKSNILNRLKRKKVRFRFDLTSARLYSFSIVQSKD